MAQTVAVVRATLTATGSGTTDFTSSGFGTPTAAIVLMSRANSTNNPQDSVGLSIGFWDGTNQRVNGVTTTDNVADSATYRLRRTDGIAGDISAAASSTTIACLYSCSAVTDGIRLTMSVDNTAAQRYATVILLKGVSAKVLTHTPGTTNGSTAESASLGFAPKLLIGASIGHTTTTPNDGSAQTTVAVLTLGATRQSDSAVRCLTWFADHAAATSTLSELYSEAIFAGQVTTSTTWSAAVTTWGSDTFTTTTTGTTGSDVMDVLALGGADLSFDFGTITTRTTTGTTDVTATVTPDALLAVLGTTDTTGTIVTDSKANGWSVGLADSSAEYSHTIFDEDAAATMNSGAVASATQVINLDSSSSGTRTDLVNATVTFSSGNFTLDYTTVDATARKGWWLAFGAAAGGRTGTLSATLAALTSSAAGTVALKGTTTATLGALTSAATGTVALKGTAAVTLGALTSSATGTVALAGTLSQSLGALTSSATGTLQIKGTTTQTLAALTLTATGASGAVTAGTLSATLGAATLSATGTVRIAGTASPSLGALTSAATGAVDIAAALGVTLGNLTVAGTGTLALRGTLTKTLGALTLLGTGSAAGGRDATLVATLAALTVVAHSSGPHSPAALSGGRVARAGTATARQTQGASGRMRQ